MIYGKLQEKATATKDIIKRHYLGNMFKPGDNIYVVMEYENGTPYNTYQTIMSRDEIVDCIKHGKYIIGLKIDKAGRLIEDPNAVDDNTKQYEKIEKSIIQKATESYYSTYIKDREEDYSPEERIIYNILAQKEKPDQWDIFHGMEAILVETASKNKLYIGGAFAGDDLHSICITNNYKNVLTYIACEYQGLCTFSEYDRDYVLDHLGYALKNNISFINEPWIEFGSYDSDNVFEAAVVLDAVGTIQGDADYRQTGAWYSEPTSKAIKAIIERVQSQNKVDFELKVLMKNIKVFRKCGFKANSPQETFKKYVKEALPGHGRNTQTIEDYIDLALAIQEIYYKNPENIRCEADNTLIIDKAGVKIERKPYILNVTKI